MNAKKILAMILATSMVVGSSMTAFATEGNEGATETSSSSDNEGTATGTGAVEGYVDTDVFKVDLPTETSFSFIIDPQGLIAQTNAAAYSGSTFENGATLFFANTDGTYNYSSTSDTYTITNKSSVEVDVAVAATLTDYDGIEVSDSKTFDSTNPAIYLALVSGDTTTAIAESGDKASATLTGSADEAPSGAYSIIYDTAAKEYSYTLDTTKEYDFDTYTFNLIGASNANADWSDLKEAAPAVSVTWTVTEHVDAPTFTATSTGLTYTTGSGDAALVSIKSITMLSGSVAYDGYNAYTYWAAATDDGSTITFATAYVTAIAVSGGKTATITYENAAGETVTTTVDGVCSTD